MLAVLGALFANAVITVLKFVAAAMTGSSGMMAEALHSVADTTNQVFLLLSLRLSKSPPDEEHPYGHGKERFFWSFVVAVSLFVAGAVFSVYKGVTAITGQSEGHHSFLIGYIVLGVAFVLETIALVITIREFRRAARAEERSFWGYFKVTRNTTIKVPLYEDIAALAGLVIAAVGLFATQVTGNPIFDGLASIGIGVILIVVAFQLGADSRGLLLGQAALPEDRQRLREIVASFPEVREVLRLLTMHLGPDSVLVNAEIHLVDGLETDQAEELLERITWTIRRKMPEVTETFMELHSGGRAKRSSSATS